MQLTNQLPAFYLCTPCSLYLQIGWRTVARRVLFFATDAVFHMAGDGRLAGIIRPNSAECGMDEENTYNRSLTEVSVN